MRKNQKPKMSKEDKKRISAVMFTIRAALDVSCKTVFEKICVLNVLAAKLADEEAEGE